MIARQNIYALNLTSSSKVRPSVKEGITAIAYFIYLFILSYGFGLVETSWDRHMAVWIPAEEWRLLAVTLPFVVLELLPLVFIIRKRRELPGSIGLRASKWKLSLIVGLAGAIPFAAVTIYQMRGLYLESSPLPGFLYFTFLIALPEELQFRGYIQTRLTGLIPNKPAAVLVTGILFALIHIPFRLASYHGFHLQSEYPYLIRIVIMHLYFTYLYTRTNNIAGAVLCHGLIDLIG